MKYLCPYCGSDKITNNLNGQGPDCVPEDEEDELYVALGNDWYDGSVDQMNCENGHRFYLPHPDAVCMDDDPLEEHQLPIEDIVTALDGQDPKAFLDAMTAIIDDDSDA